MPERNRFFLCEVFPKPSWSLFNPLGCCVVRSPITRPPSTVCLSCVKLNQEHSNLWSRFWLKLKHQAKKQQNPNLGLIVDTRGSGQDDVFSPRWLGGRDQRRGWKRECDSVPYFKLHNRQWGSTPDSTIITWETRFHLKLQHSVASGAFGTELSCRLCDCESNLFASIV